MVTAWDTPSFMAGSFGGRELMRDRATAPAASKSVVAVTGEATRRCPIGQCSTGQLHRLIVRSSKSPWPQTKEHHMPISQERELELDQELAAIVRKLERRPPMEKRGSQKPETVQVPVGRILLDE